MWRAEGAKTAEPARFGVRLGVVLSPQGVTRLLLTRIPFFREIIVSSFTCNSCGCSNAEIQSAGRIQDQGVCYTLAVRKKQVGGSEHEETLAGDLAGGHVGAARGGVRERGDPPIGSFRNRQTPELDEGLPIKSKLQI